MLSQRAEKPRGNRSWTRTVDADVEPVTAAEFKTFARIDGSTEDTQIEAMLKAVRQSAELWTGRAFISQTYVMTLDFWPKNGIIQLPRPPLISVTSIVTLDEDNVETTYSSSNYYLNTVSTPAEIILKSGATAPTKDTRERGWIKVTFKAGYGDTAANVPQQIKEAIKMWATVVYENRTPLSPEPPSNVQDILGLNKVARFLR